MGHQIFIYFILLPRKHHGLIMGVILGLLPHLSEGTFS
jgi:hypothetical protein